MNKYLHLFLIFLYVLPITTHSEPFLDIFQNESNGIVEFDKKFQTANNIHTELLKAVHYLHECLNYWKYQKYHPISYFFAKNPKKWFTEKSQQEELAEHILFIQQNIQQQVGYLGRLDLLLQEIKQTKNEKKHIDLHHSLNQLIDEILASLASEKNRETCIKNYAVYIKSRLQEHGLPPHVVRYWLEYTGLGIASIAALGYWFKHGNVIQQWFLDTKDSAALFLKENLQEPLKNIRDIFYKKSHDQDIAILDTPLVSKDVIIEKEQIVEELIFDQLKRFYYAKQPSIITNPSKVIFEGYDPIPPDEELRKIAHDGVVKRVIPEILRPTIIENNAYPIKAVMSRNGIFFPSILLQLYMEVLKGYDASKKLDYLSKKTATVIKNNEINMQLLLLIPVLLTGYLSYKIGSVINKKWNPSERIYKVIKSALGEIEKILNRSSTLESPDHGYIVYWANTIQNSLKALYGQKLITLSEYCASIINPQLTQSYRLVLTQQALRLLK